MDSEKLDILPEVVKVSERTGQLDIPIRILQQAHWAQDLIGEKKDVECLIVMIEGETLRLVDPREEEVLRKKLADSGGFGAGLRLPLKRKLTYRESDVYRMTIPVKQRPWLSLPENHRRVCLVAEAGVVEIWSMRLANTKGFPPLD